MPKQPVFQHAYSDSFRGSDLSCPEKSLAQQQFRDEVDINVMLERFGVTGQMPSGVRLPQYGDFTQVADFRSGLHTVMAARDEFMKLPAKLRNRFENDPQQFLEFCTNPDNKDEINRLGLGAPLPAKPDVPAVPPAPAAAAS